MFGFFRRAFRPMARIGEKMSEIFSIGRKAEKSIEPVLETGRAGRGWTEFHGSPDEVWMLPGSQYNPQTGGFTGGLSEIVN